MASLRVPASVPSPGDDSEQLQKAFAGWGKNEALIIQILAHGNAEQRKSIRYIYASTYNEDFSRIILTGTNPYIFFFAQSLFFKGFLLIKKRGTNHTRSQSGNRRIIQTREKETKREVSEESFGHFSKRTLGPTP
ncbi:hypothetical protein DM860_015708 [Cuscuta australis]|uniref:Annexin n=1 Tax=Cuscuta australis TaxID=267555 RepID=A0A328D099_9ASTE|nr:hypothetical protein DM860_015708 [Cuscuta australis]